MLGCAQQGNDPFVIRIIGPAEACALSYKGNPIPPRDLAALARREVRKGRTALIDSDLKRTPIRCFFSPMSVLERVGFEEVRFVGGASYDDNPARDASKTVTQTRASLVAFVQAYFRHVDRDGDGRVSKEEDADFFNMEAAKAEADLLPLGDHESFRLQMEGFRRRDMSDFDRADANRDGVLTLEEAQARAIQRFDCQDADSDQALTVEEAFNADAKCDDIGQVHWQSR